MDCKTRLAILDGLSRAKSRISSIEKSLRLNQTWNYTEFQDAAVAIDIAEASLVLSSLTESLPSATVRISGPNEPTFQKVDDETQMELLW